MMKLKLNLLDTRRHFGVVGFPLTDEFTGKAPFGTVSVRLEERIGAAPGSWEPISVRSKISSAGILHFPGLGRRVRAGSSSTSHTFRLNWDCEFYIPFYQRQTESNQDSAGLNFTIPAYNDEHPPLPVPPSAAPNFRFLMPDVNYPYEAHISLVRGKVTHQAIPLVGALVSMSVLEQVITNSAGEFAIPMRWSPPTMTLVSNVAEGNRVIELDQPHGLSAESGLSEAHRAHLRIGNRNRVVVKVLSPTRLRLSRGAPPGGWPAGTAVIRDLVLDVAHSKLSDVAHHRITLPDALRKLQRIDLP